MPRLAGIVDLTNDTQTEMQLSSNIGKGIGAGLSPLIKDAKKKRETDKLELEKERKQRTRQKIIGVLSKATKEGWGNDTTLKAVSKIPGEVSQEIQEALIQQQYQQYLASRQPKEREGKQRARQEYNYYKNLGLKPDEIDKAIRYKVGIRSRLDNKKPESLESEQQTETQSQPSPEPNVTDVSGMAQTGKARGQGTQQQTTQVDMDKLYEYARNLDEQSLAELKQIIQSGDQEKIQEAYKRLEERYGG
jgi:hypothetical protein